MLEMVNNIRQTIKENTTASDIAYLPGGFLPTANPILKNLAKLKKSYRIEILHDPIKEKYIFKLEELNIHVPTQHWGAFQKDMKKFGMVRNDGQSHSLVFSNLMCEAKEDDVTPTLHDALVACLASEPCSTVRQNLNLWTTVFGAKGHSATSVFIRFGKNAKTDLDARLSELSIVYKGDRGEAELIQDTLENTKSLKYFSVFEDYEYLYGSVIMSTFAGIQMVFTSLIDMNFIPQERIAIKDEKVLEAIDGLEGVVSYRGEVFPRYKHFNPSFFRKLKKEIMDADEPAKEEPKKEKE